MDYFFQKPSKTIFPRNQKRRRQLLLIMVNLEANLYKSQIDGIQKDSPQDFPIPVLVCLRQVRPEVG